MFQGDISKIGRIAESLSRLSSVPSRAATPIANGITKLLAKQFSDGKDPYGRNWRGLRPWTIEKGRHNPPLTDTGRSKSHTVATPMPGSGIKITLPSPLGFHQLGYRNHWTGKMVVARRVLPYAGFPTTWKTLIDKSVSKAFRDTLKGAA